MLASLAIGAMFNGMPPASPELVVSRPVEPLSDELKAKFKAAEDRAGAEAKEKARLRRERRMRPS